MSKNSLLVVAYTALFTSAIGVVAYDSHVRSKYVSTPSEAEQKAAERRAIGASSTRTVSIETPSPVENVSEPEKPTARQLPHGVFLTKETMMLEAHDGSRREVEAGAQVMLIRREHGNAIIHHDGFDYQVDERKITRNAHAVQKLIASRKS